MSERFVKWACCATCGDPVKGNPQRDEAHQGHYIPTRKNCVMGGWQYQTFDMEDQVDADIINRLRKLDLQNI